MRKIKREIQRNPECSSVFFTAETLYIRKGGNALLDRPPQEQHDLIYGYLRYFIIERGLPLPKPSYFNNKETIHCLFSEKDELPPPANPGENASHKEVMDYIKEYSQRFSGRKTAEEIPENYESPTKFILYLIERDTKEHDDFMIANHMLLGYIDHYKDVLTTEDIIEILFSVSQNTGSWFFYFLITEYSDIGNDLLTAIFGKTEHLSIAEIFERNKDTLKNSKVQAIMKSFGEHFPRLEESFFGNLGFIIYFLIKNKGTIEVDTVEDLCDNIIDFLLKAGYSFAYQNGVFIFSNKFQNENALVVSQITSQVESLMSGDQTERIKLLHSGSFFPQLQNFIGKILTASASNTFQIDELKEIFRTLSSSDMSTSPSSKGVLQIHTKGSPMKLISQQQIDTSIQPLMISSIQRANALEEQFNAAKIPNALPIGGKVHFSNPLEPKNVQIVQEISGITSTYFKLLHQDDSMCLPPCDSPMELINIIHQFTRIGVLDKDKLELQLSIPGRLPNRLAGILGSTMLFLKNYEISYPHSTFQTTHEDLTQRCIMCYDAGVLETEQFPQIPKKCEGRTDILGIKKIEEVISYYTLGNIISQSYYGGTLKNAGKEFIERYEALLQKHGLSHILNGKWVHNPDSPVGNNQDYINHSSLLKTCTDIRNSDIEHKNTTGEEKGFSFEVRNIFRDTILNNNLLPEKQRRLYMVDTAA